MWVNTEIQPSQCPVEKEVAEGFFYCPTCREGLKPLLHPMAGGDNPWLGFQIGAVSLQSRGSGWSIPSSIGTIYHQDAAGFQQRQKENTGNVFIKRYKRFAV